MSIKLFLSLAVLILIGQITAAAPLINTTVLADRVHDNVTMPKFLAKLAAARRRANSTESAGDHQRNFYPYQPYFTGCVYNYGTSRCLDVEQSRKNPQFSDAQMWQCNLNPVAQKLQFWGWVEPGTTRWTSFYIVNLDSGHEYCLDVAEGKAANGQPVRWWSCNGSAAQMWNYNIQYGLIRSDLAGLYCLDPVGGVRQRRNGQGMQLWTCTAGEPGHKFTLDYNFSPTSGVCNARPT